MPQMSGLSSHRDETVSHSKSLERLARKAEAIEEAYRSFDMLPASALVDFEVVCRVASVSEATVWRRTKSGDLPQPVRIGRSVRWRVGDLRRALGA